MVTIFDSNNILHRCHYAYGDLHTSKGYPTGSILGFMNYVYKFFRDRQSNEYFIFVWDSYSSKKKELYKEYKAHRIQKEKIIYEHKDMIQTLLADLDIQQFEVDGEEADDVIYSIAKLCRKEMHKVRIFSPDHDFEQAVNNNISIIAPLGGQKYLHKDAKWVKDKYFGLESMQIKEVMKLTGDKSSDNVAGVEGVGLKTAVKLIKANGSVRNILKNVYGAQTYNKKGEITPISAKLAKNIDDARKQINLNEDLVVLNGDIELNFELKKTIKPNWEAIEKRFQDLEFSSLLKRMHLWKEYVQYITI